MAVQILIMMEYHIQRTNAPMNQVHQTIMGVLIKSTAVVVGHNGMNKTSVNIQKFLAKTVEKNYCFVNEIMGCMELPKGMLMMERVTAPIVGMKVNKLKKRTTN
jgi:hypothetical protein